MAGKIKGLTVEIGGDTTKLGKALESVNKKSRDLSNELGQVNKLLKMDPGNADLIAQKQDILAEAIKNTSDKLDKLKEAERQVQEQFERGEASIEQVRELQREIAATEQKLKGYEAAAKEVADGNDRIANSAQEAAEETADMNGTLDSFASGGLKGLAGTLTAVVGGLVAAAEATRDYRMEMGKLDTAFTDSGFSSQAATGAYRDLVGILGEYDQSVEAANHLAKLTENEKDLATWTGDILPGVFATFGDSLPIEGLTEAANETAKVGEVTGPLADALNWAGISEDKFNESLAKCNTEQERQKLIMDTLVGVYGDASEAYKTTNKDVIAANQANADWMQSMSELGAAVEPLITDVKTMGAALVSDLVPVIEKIIDNLPVVATIIGGVTAALVAFKVSALGGLPVLITSITTAVKGLFTAMLANPIGLIILAVTALVAGFMYLWNNCEGFREFWINLWDKIKEAASKAVDWLKELPQKIWGAIQGAIDKLKTWGNNLVTSIKTTATNMLNGALNIIKELPQKIWDAIVGAVTFLVTWRARMIAAALDAAKGVITNVIDTIKELPQKIWSAIVGAVDQIANWGRNMVAKAKSAAADVVSAVVNGLKSLPSQVLSIGGNLVQGLWNGINNKLTWLKNKIKGFTQSVLGSIKNFFGVHSPARSSGALKTTDWVGEMLNEGLAVGLEDSVKTPVKAMQTVTGSVLDAAKTNIDGLTLNRQIEGNFGGSGSDLGSKLDKILAAIESGQILTIDGDALVGATATRLDKKLGQRRALAARGAI